jgi:hypothetical protein
LAFEVIDIEKKPDFFVKNNITSGAIRVDEFTAKRFFLYY